VQISPGRSALPGRSVPLTVIAAAGLAGSLLAAGASWAVGAREQHRALVRVPHRAGRHLRTVVDVAHPGLMRPVFYLGVALLCAAWLLLGRRVLDRESALPWRSVRRVCWAWAAPQLLAVPIGSRDLWAYAAQGDVLRHGFDPYVVGPARVHGGHYAAQVSPIWRHATSPYGPLWLLVSRVGAAVSGRHVLLAVLLLRLPAALGLLLITLVLPRLCGVSAAPVRVAMWAFAASPLVLVVALGGGHNDLLMAGLVAAALAIATGRAPAWCSLGVSAVVLTAAVEIKLPALVVLAFLPHVWLWYAPAAERWRAHPAALPAVVGVVLAIAAATVGAITAITGLGFGWVGRLNATDVGTAWLSVPVAAALLAKHLRGGARTTVLGSHSQPLIGKLAVLLAVAVLPTLWWLARRREPLRWLALTMFASLVLSTTVQPWYFVWPLLLAVLVPVRRAVWVAVAAVTVGLTISLGPAGGTVLNYPTIVPIAVVAALATWATLVRGITAPARFRIVAG
jgi:alpha-1,6-mannosyltransferase